jgi:hypothetical protein
MPLARIISTSAKYSDGLADDLRSRGFQVLTSAPGESISQSADLEITLNECLADDARATAQVAESKDMRVFLTPQAFAGNIRSIEMFVLTPKPAATRTLEITSAVEPLSVEPSPVEPAAVEPLSVEPSAIEPSSVEPSSNLISDSLGKMLAFAAPAPAVANGASERLETIRSVDMSEKEKEKEKEVSAAGVEDFPVGFDAWDEPGFASAEEIAPVAEKRGGIGGSIGRAILASKQSAWPDMAEMKLVPAELAPAPVRPAGVSLPAARLPERVPARSTRVSSPRDKRFWRVPIVAGVAALLALSAVWMADRLSRSSTSEGTTLQQTVPPPAEAANPGTAGAQLKATAKPPGTSASARMRAPRATAKRRAPPESDYVAKDTTVYFSRRPAALLSSKKPQAHP